MSDFICSAFAWLFLTLDTGQTVGEVFAPFMERLFERGIFFATPTE